MADLSQVPFPKHPDHARGAEEVKRELPAGEALAVEPGFERDRHDLIHCAHDDGAEATQHDQVGEGDDVLVVVVGSEEGWRRHQPANAEQQRAEAGEHEGQRQLEIRRRCAKRRGGGRRAGERRLSGGGYG